MAITLQVSPAAAAAVCAVVSERSSLSAKLSSASSKLSLPGFKCGASVGLAALGSRRRTNRNFSGMRFRIVACTSSDSATGAERKVEVVYDPEGRFNELVNDLNKSGTFQPTNLTLFSPSKRGPLNRQRLENLAAATKSIIKINVFLRVTNKRPDGYHDLASLFHVISLGDVIKFSVSPSKTKDSLTTNAFGVPLDEKNLIIKALKLYRKKTGSSTYFWVQTYPSQLGMKLICLEIALESNPSIQLSLKFEQIHLDKRVPTGAGLGGGSGNAATALWAANHLNGQLATEKELQEWSAEIGSDIPVFFSKGAAYCTGRGEVVRDIPSPFDPSTPMVLIKPPEECSTPEVFKTFKLSDCSQADPEELLDSVIKNGIKQSLCVNDLETPAFQVLPTLKQLKERISAASRGRYQAVFMSGSGSTIVGIGDAEPPPFLYDEEQYSSIFISEAYFLTRRENEWYEQPRSGSESGDEEGNSSR